MFALRFSKVDLSLRELGIQTLRLGRAKLCQCEPRLRRNGSRFFATLRTRARVDVEHVQPRERLADSFDVRANERELVLGRTKLFVARRKERRIFRRDFEADPDVDGTDAFAFDADAN